MLFQPPINITERVAKIRIQIELTKKPAVFIPRQKKYTPKTIQSMSPEILDQIVDFVDAASIISLSHCTQYYHQTLSDVFDACKKVAQIYGESNFSNSWPTFRYPNRIRFSRPITLNEAVPVFNLIKCLNKYGGNAAVCIDDFGLLNSWSTLLPRQIQLDLEANRQHVAENAYKLEYRNSVLDHCSVIKCLPRDSHIVALKVDARYFFSHERAQDAFVSYAAQEKISKLVLVHVVQQPVYLLKNLGVFPAFRTLEILRTVGAYRIDYTDFPLLDILSTCKNLAEIAFATTGCAANDMLWVKEVCANLKFGCSKFRKVVFRCVLDRDFWDTLRPALDGWNMEFVAEDYIFWEREK
ncbi:hypothetical protein HK100_001321 [Physocladia obscura]|uniref:F-box domain-containing protein n=1 Tax=Physocladia obscura TaxID=109957 RepID=A0AAD5SZW8_9FUNG|nr:hypothetical protein HK100_001321 [Physocladia obscura]